jgi:hypothetical protein
MNEHPGVEEIAGHWTTDNSDIAKWVRSFSNEFYRLELQGMEERVSRRLGVPVAELAAVLKLAVLSDEELLAISAKQPPRVFWFHLAEVKSVDELEELLSRFDVPAQKLPSMAEIQKLLDSEAPPDLFDRVRSLPADDYWHLAKKAKSADFVAPKERSLLASCALARQKGILPSIKQAKWAVDIIERLVAGKMLVVSEFEQDSETNARILQHLEIGEG